MSPPSLPASPESPLRRRLRQLAGIVALTGIVAVPLLYVTGGFEIHIQGVEIRAHRPLRALWIFGIGLVAFIALGGRASLSWRAILLALGDYLAQVERAVLSRLPPSWIVAATLASVVALLGMLYGTKAASGSDSYGYVSQADLWLNGRLTIEQPFAAEVPWPKGPESFITLGYRTAPRRGVPGIVPTYSPGLPLLLAAAKKVAGHDAMFLVVPLLGGLLVLATYGIGCRLGSSGAGLIGAALVATSPTVLYMLMSTMTDVPVAAMWASAFYLMTGRGPARALGAGLAAAVAVLIRPNLAPLVGVAGLYYAAGVFDHTSRMRAIRHGLLFILGVLPGVLAVGAINNALYGSPLTSGYGGLDSLFGWDNLWPNMTRYSRWMVETQSPAAIAGALALFVPSRRLWPGLGERSRLFVAALLSLTVWALYCGYLVFDAWWYLRFLLTSWPFIMVGIGAVAMAVWSAGGRLTRALATAGVGLLILFQLGVVSDVPVFNQWSGERRYVVAAQMVGRLTPPNSVVLSMQHSGTIRYYGGRMTLRYDLLDAAWLDRAVAWLRERGVATYLLVEDWEVERVQGRFATSDVVARLAQPPLAFYEHPGRMLLFDLSGPPIEAGRTEMVTGVDEGLIAPRPVAAPTLTFHTRAP